VSSAKSLIGSEASASPKDETAIKYKGEAKASHPKIVDLLHLVCLQAIFSLPLLECIIKIYQSLFFELYT
jgi:hypothetical protein